MIDFVDTCVLVLPQERQRLVGAKRSKRWEDIARPAASSGTFQNPLRVSAHHQTASCCKKNTRSDQHFDEADQLWKRLLTHGNMIETEFS